jgi:hypothetical protein
MRPPKKDGGDLYEQDYALMSAIKAISDASGVPVVAVHHSRKAKADDPFDSISGTNGLAGATDTALILTRDRGSSDANLYLRGRDVEEADHALKFDPVAGQWSRIGDPALVSMHEGRQSILALIEKTGPMYPIDIARELERDPGTVRQTLRRMYNAGQINAKDGKYSASDAEPW